MELNCGIGAVFSLNKQGRSTYSLFRSTDEFTSVTNIQIEVYVTHIFTYVYLIYFVIFT